MDISVLFLGVLAEVTGTHRKHYRDVNSFTDLMHRIGDDYPELVNHQFLITVNKRLVNEEPVLRDGDEVAYLPPFAGD